jgi:hypothetical protein
VETTPLGTKISAVDPSSIMNDAAFSGLGREVARRLPVVFDAVGEARGVGSAERHPAVPLFAAKF